MGLNQSQDELEKPAEKYTATLHYFAGRGLADQIRWLLAATQVSFVQRTITTREKFLKMAARQLPFGQLPLLQIDGLDIVQSQAAVRYLAARAKILGNTAEDQVKCDMIAESVRDVLSLPVQATFKKYRGVPKGSGINMKEWGPHLELMKEKWTFAGARFEAILESNLPLPTTKDPKGKPVDVKEFAREYADSEKTVFLVGGALTYVDILMAHLITWMVEECGPDIMTDFPLLVSLQNYVISLPGLRTFIRGPCYYPLGDANYVETVETVLGRK